MHILVTYLKQGAVLLNTTEYSDLHDSELASCNCSFVYKKMAIVKKVKKTQNAQKTRY